MPAAQHSRRPPPAADSLATAVARRVCARRQRTAARVRDGSHDGEARQDGEGGLCGRWQAESSLIRDLR